MRWLMLTRTQSRRVGYLRLPDLLTTPMVLEAPALIKDLGCKD